MAADKTHAAGDAAPQASDAAPKPEAEPSGRAGSAPVRRLKDYRPSDWLVSHTRLSFTLHPTATRVAAELSIRRNPDAPDGEGRPHLRLDGRGLSPIEPTIDGAPLQPGALVADAQGLTVRGDALPGDAFVWRVETELNPSANTALEGLYMSAGMYCTQCEAQGFRKITYALDRPDVMSTYDVRIVADEDAAPVLLSNGNPAGAERFDDGRHAALWSDPHPKPTYLFALVGGRLASVEDRFTTASGREIALAVFTRPGDEGRTGYALDALKRSMAWDERVYGREYDLDQFMIVAVDDFNMGAMENKGLNIFNSKYVLASDDTATDRDFELIEGIVAHEYFHNWTGNRITCRDWFQLCLKEGLTVYRDQRFSADMRSAAVNRIEQVKGLRARQFREDAGPLAHPVRPDAYVEINNFYTSTVYEKGAELVRMLHTLFGDAGYRAALDLYFSRHDGQACTVEQFIKCFEDANRRDLSRFALWWRQAGTPRLTLTETRDADGLELAIVQSTPASKATPEPLALEIPLRVGLIDADGRPSPIAATPGPGVEAAPSGDPATLLLNAQEGRIRFDGAPDGAIVSFNRGFAAPVIVRRSLENAERRRLLSSDPDPFARWEAGRAYALDLLAGLTADISTGAPPRDVSEYVAAVGATLRDDELDPAFRALVAEPPSEDEIAGAAYDALDIDPALDPAERPGVDPDAVHAARTHLKVALARELESVWTALYAQMATPGAYRPVAADAAKRTLKNAALLTLAHLRTPDAFARAEAQFDAADNMTDRMPALQALVHCGAPSSAGALQRFYDAWSQDPLVLGKWLMVQATSPLDDAGETVARLTAHPAFDWRNPNKFRALIGAFAMGNPVAFHRRDGSGYRFVAGWLLKLDSVNPQTAARVATAFETWPRCDARRRKLIQDALRSVAETPGLSTDLSEMTRRMLG